MGGWTKEEEFRAPHVHRIVNPLGTVVSGASSSSPSPPSEGDSYILSNEDEALFRPVVRAPRSLPAPSTPPTRPLSSRTLLPAQHVSVPAENTSISTVPAASLTDNVVIPAKLSQKQSSLTVSMESEESTALPPESGEKFKIAEIPKTEESHKTDEIYAKDEIQNVDEKFETTDIVKNPVPAVRESKKKSKRSKDDRIQLQKDVKVDSLAKKEVKEEPNSILAEFSIASNEIQFCNNEVVGNLECEQDIHITAYQYEDVLENTDEKYDVSVANIVDNRKMECVKDDVPFVDIMQDPVSIDISEFELNNSDLHSDDNTTMVENCVEPELEVCLLNELNTKVADEVWEVLTDTKQKEGVKTEKEIPIEVTKNIIFNDLKSKTKKNKKGKPKSCNMVRSSSPIINMYADTEIMDAVQSDPLSISSVSWNEKVSIDNTNLVTFSSEEDIYKVLSAKYNRNNIVVANCDMPETTELCFVDEHHSYIEEPPEFEPSNYEVNEEDYLYFKSAHYSLDTEEEVYVLKEAFERTELSEEFNKLGILKKADKYESECNGLVAENRINTMEKSSDDENVSSQGDSDDCTQIKPSNNTGGSLSADVEEPEVEEIQPLVSINATIPASKASKKKSKRKRR